MFFVITAQLTILHTHTKKKPIAERCPIFVMKAVNDSEFRLCVHCKIINWNCDMFHIKTGNKNTPKYLTDFHAFCFLNSRCV